MEQSTPEALRNSGPQEASESSRGGVSFECKFRWESQNATGIIETVASVSAINFVDLDLDTDELGGACLVGIDIALARC